MKQNYPKLKMKCFFTTSSKVRDSTFAEMLNNRMQSMMIGITLHFSIDNDNGKTFNGCLKIQHKVAVRKL